MIKMELGKIYYLDYGSNNQIVGRYLNDDGSQYIFFDLLHYWNGYETFQQNKPYCVRNGVEDMREASKSEKMNLIRFEIEHDCI